MSATAGIVLTGYRFSVYSRICCICLRRKGPEYNWVEYNPFDDNGVNPHPFDRVPHLRHDGFDLYETGAIARYLEARFPQEPLWPGPVQARARTDQVLSIIDAYGYWPMVRQVFSHRVFRPLEGSEGDSAQVAAGLAASERTLDVLDAIAHEGFVLGPRDWYIGEIALAVMLDYFTLASEGAAALGSRVSLSRFWDAAKDRDDLVATRPDLSLVAHSASDSPAHHSA